MKFKRIKPDIEIKSKLSSWKHPFKWWRERKYRKIMQGLMISAWHNGMREDVEQYAKDMMTKGHAIIKDKNYWK